MAQSYNFIFNFAVSDNIKYCELPNRTKKV